MADPQHRESFFPLQFFQQLNDLRLYRRIERTRCLVADQKRRLHSKSPRNCGSLALSAARPAGIAFRRFRGKLHFFQQFRQTKTGFFPAHSLIPKSFQNPGFERLHWIEGILRGLEDHLYFPVNFALPPAFSSEDFLAFQQNAACIRLDQSGDQTGRRAFSASALPDQAKTFPRIQCEADAVHGGKFRFPAGSGKVFD